MRMTKEDIELVRKAFDSGASISGGVMKQVLLKTLEEVYEIQVYLAQREQQNEKFWKEFEARQKTPVDSL